MPITPEAKAALKGHQQGKRKEEDPNKRFKASNGMWLTDSLFRENVWGDKIHLAVYSTKEYDLHLDGKIYPSLKKLYMSVADPTEYKFAEKHLGGWTHWNRMLNNQKLRPMIDKWREELEVKLRSQAFRALRSTAVNEGAKGTTAAKWLAEKGWEPKRGRPSKEEVERTKKVHAGIHEELEEDFERMGLLN